MASEKAREKRQSKKRPASAGPRKRIGGNHGNGQSTQFKPGENSQNGHVFRRGRAVPQPLARRLATAAFAARTVNGYGLSSEVCPRTRPAAATRRRLGSGDREDRPRDAVVDITAPRNYSPRT